MAARPRFGRLAGAGQAPTPVRVAVAVLGLTILAAIGFHLVRGRFGAGFSSDTYSYLAWAKRALAEGELGHTPYDYTVPKPLEMLVAAIGELVGYPVAVFGTWAALSYFAAVLAAAALAKRFAGWPAAAAAGVLALFMPGLVLAGYAADSIVPYAACVVGAAAFAPGRTGPPAGLLGVAGLLRPEAWGLAAINAALSWRRASSRERALAVAAVLVPAAVWLSFDWIATGDPLYASHSIDRFGVQGVPVQDVPGVVGPLLPKVVGWPLVALALAALVGGLRRCPLDRAVLFPLAMALGLVVELQLGLIGEQPLGRYAVGLFLFLPAGAAIALAQAPGRARIPVLTLGVLACLAVVAGRQAENRDFIERRGRAASELERRMAPAAQRAVARGGLVATESQWQGALSLYSDVPREHIVPVWAVGKEIDPADVGAYLVLARRQATGEGPAGDVDEGPLAARSSRWRLYLAESSAP